MKKLFYIFLDIDGVFWDYKWLKEEINAGKIKKGGIINTFKLDSIIAFNYLLKILHNNYDIVVVISSTYRNNMNKLTELFCEYNVDFDLIKEITPLKNLNGKRDDEILAFIKERNVNEYLIIDDEEINARKFFKNHSTIKTNIFENSLSLEMVKNAIKNIKIDETSEEN